MHEHLEIFPVFNLNLGIAAIQSDCMKLKRWKRMVEEGPVPALVRAGHF